MKQGRSHHVDPGIGALGREDRRHQQLKRTLVNQGADGLWVEPLRAREGFDEPAPWDRCSASAAWLLAFRWFLEIRLASSAFHSRSSRQALSRDLAVGFSQPTISIIPTHADGLKDSPAASFGHSSVGSFASALPLHNVKLRALSPPLGRSRSANDNPAIQ